MITKISAEFESFDIADIAARRMKEAIKDITRIRIFPKNEQLDDNLHHWHSDYPTNTVDNNFLSGDYGVIPYAYPVIMSDAQVRYFAVMPNNNVNRNNDINRTGPYIVEVQCKDSFADEVFSKFISLGGLDLNEI